MASAEGRTGGVAVHYQADRSAVSQALPAGPHTVKPVRACLMGSGRTATRVQSGQW